LLEIESDAAVAPAILLVAAAPAASLVVDAREHCETGVWFLWKIGRKDLSLVL
jgi:hypothetical protein